MRTNKNNAKALSRMINSNLVKASIFCFSKLSHFIGFFFHTAYNTKIRLGGGVFGGGP